jgi:hypothetical protein
MFKRTLIAVALAGALPGPAQADVSDADLTRLRAEFDQKLQALQADYEARLKAMEARLAQANATAKSSADTAAAAQQTAQAAADQAAQAGQTQAGANAFNPEISLILQGGYVNAKSGERRPTGYLQDADISAPTRGFSLDDTELVMAANIDPYFRGSTNIVLADGQADIEEAWFQTLGLNHGLTVKGGRFISGIGYQNEQHPHAWDFADNNLMYQTLYGEHLVQDGLQVKWLAPTDTLVELGAEVGSGFAFPGGNDAGGSNGAGDWAAYGHVGGDMGDSSSWRAGVSYVAARPQDRHSTLLDSLGNEADTTFSGNSKTWMADFVWKWAPLGNPYERNFKFQAEAFQRKEDGTLTYDPDGADVPGAYRADQTGWYAQAIYQFMPRWRVGLRHDRLGHGSQDFGSNDPALQTADYSPNRWSLMTDYAPSEFSMFRLQLTRDHAMLGNPDNRVITLQYIYSLGPHGAHIF